MAKKPKALPCQWTGLQDALSAFVGAASGVQGSQHIKPLHWYVACRLVIEGGFRPEWITPRPPFTVEAKGAGRKRQRLFLHHKPAAAGAGERTVLGGLKTKSIDVVVAVDDVGPCIGVSLKGTLNAFRNLTNRMEEAVGDCTNLHITYPAFVYGFFHVLRATREGPFPPNMPPGIEPDEDGNVKAADVAVLQTGEMTESIKRYHNALVGLAGRRGIREDMTRYEALTLTLVSPGPETLGQIVTTYPPAESPLRFDDLFRQIYDQYDQRFVYGAPELAIRTRRLEWDAESPVLSDPRVADYNPRIAVAPIAPPIPDDQLPDPEVNASEEGEPDS